jgi:outer membrane protein OmpA-like peptidoglycan-associated protein
LQTTVRQCINTKGYGVEDIITDEFFTGGWSEMVNQRRLEELNAKHSPTGPSDCDVTPVPVVQTLSGSEDADRYNPETAEYWEKYYKGVTETDKKGFPVELGGSRVNNLADNAEIFGINPGSTNIVKIVYTTFGDIVKKLYPDLVPSYPAADEVINTRFLKNVLARAGSNIASADVAAFNADDNIRETVSKKSWAIEFTSGSSEFTPSARAVMEKLFNDLVIASNLKVEVHGHTDNVGDPDANMKLSERRAFAIKTWLENKSANNFPEGRISIFAHGASNPLVSNDTPDGRAKNRRVEIIMGK